MTIRSAPSARSTPSASLLQPHQRTATYATMSAGHGDNRETLAQAMYGKSEDDMSREELNEMKRLMRGEAATEEEGAAEHDAQVRSDDNGDFAASLHRETRTGPPTDQMASTGRMSADDVRREYPSTEQSAQGVTTPVESDKKT